MLPLKDQDKRDQEQLRMLNEHRTMDNLVVPIQAIRVIDHHTNEVLEEIHVGQSCGMYATLHELTSTYGRCLTKIWYMAGNIDIYTLAVGEELFPARTK